MPSLSGGAPIKLVLFTFVASVAASVSKAEHRHRRRRARAPVLIDRLGGGSFSAKLYIGR